jgi:hypothetical protein
MRRFNDDDRILARSLADQLGHLTLLDEVLAEPDEIDL